MSDNHPSSAWLSDDPPSDFELWLETLKTDVIQDEYGYERGEFTVYPELWRPLFDDGCTPAEAFKRALDSMERKP
jgi:hypothetical protein